MIAATAEMMRTPFDMPIGESELTMGFFTEYSGLDFLFFIFRIHKFICYVCDCSSNSSRGYHVPLLPMNGLTFMVHWF